MATSSAELESEFELLPEFEDERGRGAKSEAFFNHLAAMGDRRGRSQALRRIALAAARQALRSSKVPPLPVIEGESEFEFEYEALGSRPVLAAAALEHIGHAATEAETEQEVAEHFLPLIPLAAKAILPLAAKALPMIAKSAPSIIARVAPSLTRGATQVARTLFRSPTTRPLLRAMPNIARRTMVDIARRAARGGRITPQSAVRLLARQTARVLGNPRKAATAYRRSKAFDQRYHRTRRRIGPSATQGAAPMVCPTCGR